MNPKTAESKSSFEVQELCIDLPGETVRCWRSSDRVKIILRKHRDVFFDINIKQGATYTIESKSEFYSPRDKRLFKMVIFKDGEQLHIWIGRKFKGHLILRCDGRILGSFEPNVLDKAEYDSNPKTKPEPLMVIMGRKDDPFAAARPAEDRFWMSSSQGMFKPMFDPKIATLRNYGSEYLCQYSPEESEVGEYACVTEALASEIQPQILKQLESGAVEGTAGQIFVPPKSVQPASGLYNAMAATVEYIGGADTLNSNVFKESAGYIQENWKMLNKITMTVRVEKRIVGKYRVIFRGVPLTKKVAQALGVAKNARVAHETASVGSAKTAFIDGGFVRTGRSGYGGFKRIILTSAENFRGGLKMQGIGTVIDIVGDINTVYFSESGSKDLSEFLGRSGISLLKAGATAAIGGVLAAALTAVAIFAMGSAALPVAFAALAVIAGYYFAASIVDSVDEKYNLKNTVADWVK